MSAPAADPVAILDALLRELDAALDTATRHAGGELDADAFAHACARLAQSFIQARPALQATGGLPSTQLQQLQARLQTLHELHARLSAQARAALAALLPQDALADYARLGVRAPLRAFRG